MSKKHSEDTLIMILCVAIAVVSLSIAWYKYTTGRSVYLVIWNLVNAIGAIIMFFKFLRPL